MRKKLCIYFLEVASPVFLIAALALVIAYSDYVTPSAHINLRTLKAPPSVSVAVAYPLPFNPPLTHAGFHGDKIKQVKTTRKYINHTGGQALTTALPCTDNASDHFGADFCAAWQISSALGRFAASTYNSGSKTHALSLISKDNNVNS